ncbi:MAG: hypothetical protein HY892_18475 [Deltaproteobacteria bacterium]|nr:hypothetical protein [Deltaproteobacteria bacterium]
MNPHFFSRPDLQDLLARSRPQRLALGDLYSRLPATRCRRRARCCSLLPETSLPEALAALAALQRFPPARRLSIQKRVVRYFLINPLEITSCPFLEGGGCLIYADRFFGCRAYGLWSPEEYARRAKADRPAKKMMGEQWLRLGVRLPVTVIDFQVPYCRQVFPALPVSDQVLGEIEEGLELLARDLNPWTARFQELYFSDLSFLIAGLIFGVPAALRLKFTLVKERLQTGRRDRLDEVLLNLEGRADILS